jgi:hypothetical protein
MKSGFISFLLFVISAGLSAQEERYTLSGTVRDSASGESIIGATVRIPEAKTGISTNAYGFYSITLPAGNYTVICSYVGRQTKSFHLDLQQNSHTDIVLSESAIALRNVEVTARQTDQNIRSVDMGRDHLDIEQIKSIPVIFGEIDVLKTLTLLPGVMSAGEGNTGFYVRGGGADQNLILLDEATVYNASHLFGFFSVFNGDAVKDITLIKGGIPAEYGGRLSSVLDIHTNDGNSKKFTARGGVGLISSRLTLEGPLGSDKGSILLSGRRTYADLFPRQFGPGTLKDINLYFYDLNLKANFRLTEKDQIFLSGYFGRDIMSIPSLDIIWGNSTATLRWNHLFSDKLFLNTSAVMTDYQYKITISSGPNAFAITSSIRDYTGKMGFEYYLNENNKIKFGLAETYHSFTPGKVSSNGLDLLNDPNIDKKYALEGALYLSNEQTLNEHIIVNYGLRYSMFDQIGPGKTFHYDSNGTITDTTTYTGHRRIQEYGGLEPRAAINFLINKSSSVKASYTRTMQYVQLLSNTTSSTPVDLWVPCSNVIKPQIGDQYGLGYFRNFHSNQYETSVEVYYKTMQNQIDYRPGADLVLNPIVESQLYFGRGRAYGTEFFIKKKTGKLNGWIGYTISRTERQFNEINGGNWYASRQDRTHDVSVVAVYDLNRHLSFGAVWVYATGNAVTFPVAKYEYGGHLFSYYTTRNGYRMPDYHRLDLSLTWHCKKRKHLESEWNVSVYNVYNRHNTYSIDFQQDPNNPDNTQAIRTWLFGIIPSITYNFKF